MYLCWDVWFLCVLHGDLQGQAVGAAARLLG